MPDYSPFPESNPSVPISLLLGLAAIPVLLVALVT